jgi:putative hydrolase of the HAD superfamily
VEGYFPEIFDITFTQFIPKPNPEPYHQVLAHLCLDGRDCMMIEDMPANLKPAKNLGMTTVLVGPGMEGLDGVVDHTIDNILGLENILKNLRRA